MGRKKKEKKISWLKKTTKIVGMDPHSFKEAWAIQINGIQSISVGILIIILLFLFNYVLFSYTPISNMLPEYVTNKNNIKIQAANKEANRLKKQVLLQEKFIKNFQNVILGTVPIDSVKYIDTISLDNKNFNLKIDTNISKAEHKLTSDYSSRLLAHKKQRFQYLNNLYLFDPVEGTISQKFDKKNHPGVDLVTTKDEEIKACLDGMVLNTSDDDKDGKTIILLHKNGLISVYKHAKSVFVKPGEHISVGEAIGIVGNTGTRSTGPHLHFELWGSTGPLNPMDYFSFGN